MYQVAVLGRRDLPLAPDEYAGFTMALLRMLSFAETGSQPRAASPVRTTPAPAPSPSRAGATAPAAKVAAPAASAAPTAPAASEPVASNVDFDGDWPALVERLGLTGLAGMVARHGELASYRGGNFELVVPETHRMYAEKAYQDKLKGELQKHFGPAVRLTVRVGNTAGTSLAANRSRELEKRQASAAEAIEDDPFVRDLVRDLGAEVVTSSIRPADDASPNSEKR
jgi:DNA polymerase-3 subunit gamma/tau